MSFSKSLTIKAMAFLTLLCAACTSEDTPVAGVSMSIEEAEKTAAQAYLWGWPLANMLTRYHRVGRVPKAGHLMGVAPVAPPGQLAMLADYIKPDQKFVACPNQDVVYGAGMMNLEEGPIVLQVPDFDDRYWVYAIYDARTDQIAPIGLQHGTKRGHYLVVGPDWNGETPSGIEAVFRSTTNIAFIIPRVFMNDTAEDRAAIQPIIDQILMYPLTEFDGQWRTFDWSNAPRIPYPMGWIQRSSPKWVDPTGFLDQLAEILERIPPLPGEEPLYDQYRTLVAAAKQNRPIKNTMIEAAKQTESGVIEGFLRWSENGEPAGNGWQRSYDSANWGTNYRNRTASARSNIFENVQEETRYYFTDYDISGNQLDGNGQYRVTFPAGELPPVNGFWSMTLYNESHFFYENPLNRYSLGTKNTTLQRNEDGSLTLYAGNTSPGEDKESNWLP
ncbi:MAG: DUF1254 domain-containing protein, partial [Pseudomonadota bacterium]